MFLLLADLFGQTLIRRSSVGHPKWLSYYHLRYDGKVATKLF